MMLVNTSQIEGKKITATLGLVKGSSVRAKNIGIDILASLKTIIGGEIGGYTKLMIESREMATSRMVDEAKALGANAIVNVRFATSEIMPGTSEILAYGTAVKLK